MQSRENGRVRAQNGSYNLVCLDQASNVHQQLRFMAGIWTIELFKKIARLRFDFQGKRAVLSICFYKFSIEAATLPYFSTYSATSGNGLLPRLYFLK